MRNNTLGVHGQFVDGESLQTDVMRFMAIIAFCLIAILALVRNVEPAPAADKAPAADQKPAADKAPAAQKEPAADKAPTAQKEPAADKEPATLSKPIAPQKPARREPKPKPQPAAIQPSIQPSSQPAPAPLPAKPTPAPEKVVVVAPVAPPTPETDPQTDTPSRPSPEVQQEQGLSLRFASDRDFMRLVNKGEIQVYAFHAGNEVFGLARDFEFNQARAPGRVYELMPDTIPQLVVSALQRATDNAEAYTWGIRLPAGLESRIRRYVDEAAVGELVIDRFGEVHHVAG